MLRSTKPIVVGTVVGSWYIPYSLPLLLLRPDSIDHHSSPARAPSFQSTKLFADFTAQSHHPSDALRVTRRLSLQWVIHILVNVSPRVMAGSWLIALPRAQAPHFPLCSTIFLLPTIVYGCPGCPM